MSDFLCPVCEQPVGGTWTDQHGIAACLSCGQPLRVLHYEGGRRVEKPIASALEEWFLPFARRYWRETRRLAPSGCNLPGSDYEIASAEDFRAFNEWMEEHREGIEAAAAGGAALAAPAEAPQP